MANQVQAMKQQVGQLRSEARIKRVPVSAACADLIKFVSENEKTDALVNGMPQSENPFKETKGCAIL